MDDTTPAGDATGPQRPPSLEDSLRNLGEAGRAGFASTLDTGKALRGLLLADLALARAALLRTAVWAALALVFAASGWLLLMAALVALLQRAGLSWLAALSVAAALSLAMAALGGWLAARAAAHMRLAATRRQLAKLGLGDGGEDA